MTTGHAPCPGCDGEGVVEETLNAPWLTREAVCSECGGSGCAPECVDLDPGGSS